MPDEDRKKFTPQKSDHRKHPAKRKPGNRTGNTARKSHSLATSSKNTYEKNKLYRPGEPELPTDLDISLLDPEIRKELRTLEKRNADRVAEHLLMIEIIGDEDPLQALEHARAAKERAGRLGAIRQITGLLAYSCGLWKEAISELKAARRISGSLDIVPIIADCERGLLRPEKALELIHSINTTELALDTRIELKIVESGAYRDMDNFSAALTCLESDDLYSRQQTLTHARLYYAYAEAQLAAGDTEEAKKWFSASNNADPDGSDASERMTQLAPS